MVLDETHVNRIIKKSVLRNGNEERLMVSSSVDRREFVSAGRKTVGNIGAKDAILSRAVQAFEEHEFRGVGDSGLG